MNIESEFDDLRKTDFEDANDRRIVFRDKWAKLILAGRADYMTLLQYLPEILWLDVPVKSEKKSGAEGAQWLGEEAEKALTQIRQMLVNE